jgi:hypothetical protein
MSNSNKDDNTGFNVIPARYNTGDREAIDLIRDLLGDEGFIAYCCGNVMKYTLRAGNKGPAEEDLEKALWYTMMAQHVADGTPDPRSNRPGFKKYERR